MSEEVQVTTTVKVETVFAYKFERERALDFPDFMYGHWDQASGGETTYDKYGQKIEPIAEWTIYAKEAMPSQVLLMLVTWMKERGWQFVRSTVSRHREAVTIPGEDIVEQVISETKRVVPTVTQEGK